MSPETAQLAHEIVRADGKQLRACWFCGRSFWAMYGANFCSANHRDRELHAVQLLRGTHGYRNGRFVRLEGRAA